MKIESSLDQEREAPLDELDAWIDDDEDERYPLGVAIPTGTITITSPPPPTF